MTGARDITQLCFSSNLAGIVAKKIEQSFYSIYSYSGIESIEHALRWFTEKMLFYINILLIGNVLFRFLYFLLFISIPFIISDVQKGVETIKQQSGWDLPGIVSCHYILKVITFLKGQWDINWLGNFAYWLMTFQEPNH